MEKYIIFEVGTTGKWFYHKGEAHTMPEANKKVRMLVDQNLGKRYLITKPVKYVRAKYCVPDPIRMEVALL